jgi:hypothetical protein
MKRLGVIIAEWLIVVALLAICAALYPLRPMAARRWRRA